MSYGKMFCFTGQLMLQLIQDFASYLSISMEVVESVDGALVIKVFSADLPPPK